MIRRSSILRSTKPWAKLIRSDDNEVVGKLGMQKAFVVNNKTISLQISNTIVLNVETKLRQKHRKKRHHLSFSPMILIRKTSIRPVKSNLSSKERKDRLESETRIQL